MFDDRYELGALLGRGGMADVYRARDRQTGQDVAIKLFRPGIELLDAPARRRREAQVALSLDHPALVRLLEARSDYLVMELVEGETLGAALRRQPLTEREVLRIGAALSAALEHVHARGIVHRDVKPANVLLTDDGWPKLTDFGVARGLDSTQVTLEGFTVGTANYLSPEQVTGAEVGVASDVYSLGLVLIEALTGSPVYPGHGVEAALARLHRDPKPPTGISPGLADLLAAMTAREPRRRPTATQARRRFAQLSAAVAGMAPLARPRRRAATALGLLGSAAAATVALAVLLASGPPGGAPKAQAAAPSSASPAPRSTVPASNDPTPAPAHRTQPALVAVQRRDPGTLQAAVAAHAHHATAKGRAKAATPHHGHGAKNKGGHGPGKHKGHGKPRH